MVRDEPCGIAPEAGGADETALKAGRRVDSRAQDQPETSEASTGLCGAIACSGGKGGRFAGISLFGGWQTEKNVVYCILI